jgi:competence protein ComGC
MEDFLLYAVIFTIGFFILKVVFKGLFKAVPKVNQTLRERGDRKRQVEMTKEQLRSLKLDNDRKQTEIDKEKALIKELEKQLKNNR